MCIMGDQGRIKWCLKPGRSALRHDSRLPLGFAFCHKPASEFFINKRLWIYLSRYLKGGGGVYLVACRCLVQSILLCLCVFTFLPIGALVVLISIQLSRCSWRIDMGNAFQTTEKTHLLLTRCLSVALLSGKFEWLIFEARVEIRSCEFFGKGDEFVNYSETSPYVIQTVRPTPLIF